MIRNYIRKIGWRVVKLISRWNADVGEIALHVFAICYFEFEEPKPQDKMSLRERRDRIHTAGWDAKRLAYFHGEPRQARAVIPAYNIQESLYEGVR